MRKIIYKILALILILLFFSPVASLFGKGDTAGEDGGKLKCETNLQLIPQSSDVGGGNIHWHLEGEAASEFRTTLAETVGNQSLYPDVADGNATLSREEVGLYLRASRMLESYLQRGGELRTYRKNKAYSTNGFTPQRNITPDDPIHFYGVKITRSSLNTDSITEDTKGLVGTSPEDTSPIDIHYKISFHSGPGTKEYDIDMDDPRVATSVWDSLIMPARRDVLTNASSDPNIIGQEISLKHSDILVKEGEPQGVVLKNDNLMDETNYTFYPDSDSLEIHEGIDSGDNITIAYAYGYDWEGKTEFSHWSFIVGTNSFYSPEVEDGSFYLFRTPAGEVLYFSSDFEGSSAPGSNIKWNNFKILENPQILFVIIFIFGYYTATMPKKYFKDYKEGYHAKYQKKAEKNRFIHLGGKLLTVALIIFYFVPTLGPLFVNGPMLIVLSIAFMVLSVLLSKMYYSSMKSKISEEYKTPPQTTSKTIKKTQTVKKPTQTKKKNKKTKQIYCDKCGEVFTVPKKRNLLTIRCPVCGDRQRKLKEGYNYLLMGEEEKHSYSLFKDFMKEGLSGLVLTTTIPSKIREMYGISERKIRWISDTSSDKFKVVDPTRLEFDITRSIKNFAEKEGAAVILLDDIDYLVTENGFQDTIKFLKKVTDTTSMHATTFLVHIDPHSFGRSRLSKIKKKFDNIERFKVKEDKKSKKTY